MVAFGGAAWLVAGRELKRVNAIRLKREKMINWKRFSMV
jgi:hypothetical protein